MNIYKIESILRLTYLTIEQWRLFAWKEEKSRLNAVNKISNIFRFQKYLTLSLTSVISTEKRTNNNVRIELNILFKEIESKKRVSLPVKEQTPSKLGSPWSVALTVTDTNFPSSPSRSNTLLVDTSPVSSSTVNLVPFWFGCWTMEYLTWRKIIKFL